MTATATAAPTTTPATATLAEHPLAEKALAHIGLPRHPEMPAEFAERWKLAEAFADAGIVPEGYREKDGNLKVSRVFVALQYAAELGLSPALGLHKIAVINNVPCLEFKAKLGMARASGLLEAAYPEWNYGRTSCTYRVKRIGDKRIHVRTFTLDDAKQGGLLGKQNWQRWSPDMLEKRAGSRALDEAFPDIYMGLATTDEVDDCAAGAPVAVPRRSDAWVMNGDRWLDLMRIKGYRKVNNETFKALIATAMGNRTMTFAEGGYPVDMTEAEHGAAREALTDWKPSGAGAAPSAERLPAATPAALVPPTTTPTSIASAPEPAGPVDLFGADPERAPVSPVAPEKIAEVCRLAMAVHGKDADVAHIVSRIDAAEDEIGDLACATEGEVDFAIKVLTAKAKAKG